MARRRTSRETLLSLAAEIHPDDGIDPHEFARGAMPRKEGRKVWQLCAQVADTLNLVLGGEFEDPLLQCLQVVSVDPAPDASRLLVTVQAGMPGETINPAEVLARLEVVSGRLRCEVAAAITRKKTPRLTFRVL